MSPIPTSTKHDYSHVKAIASDLDGTLVVSKFNG